MVRKMAKNSLRQDLLEKTHSFKMFGKRRCDLTREELKEYNRIRKQISRQNYIPVEQEDILSGKTQNKRF
jgi:hypothetical protein